MKPGVQRSLAARIGSSQVAIRFPSDRIYQSPAQENYGGSINTAGTRKLRLLLILRCIKKRITAAS